MNASDDTYGQIRNGVLVVSGSNPSIKVAGGVLVISDGPRPDLDYLPGPVPPLKERMVELRIPRAECGAGMTLDRIIVTRPDGFITFAAVKWMHETGVNLAQLDWDGTVLLANGVPSAYRDHPDKPAIRRAQALAAGSPVGIEIMRRVLTAKLRGQAAVARMLGSDSVVELIGRLADNIATMTNPIAILGNEGQASTRYWDLWGGVRMRFARRDAAPEHWLPFGMRRPSGSSRARNAVTAPAALYNYLCGVAISQISIALQAVGLDPGIGIFHADVDGRVSLAYDMVEVLRPYIEAWLLCLLSETSFAKRDFYEETNGTIRITRPLSSWIALTAPLWAKGAEIVSRWLADCLARAARPAGFNDAAIEAAETGAPIPQTSMAPAVISAPQRALSLPSLPQPYPTLPAPGRSYRPAVAHEVMPRACWECGRALASSRLDNRFCSATCVGIYRAEMRKLIPAEIKGPLAPELARALAGEEARKATLSRAGTARNEWERKHRVDVKGKDDTRTAAERAGLEAWYGAEIRPRLAEIRTIDVARNLEVSRVYARKIVRGELIPHPRHFAALAAPIGIEPPMMPQ